MPHMNIPREYPEWRQDSRRWRDAFHTFGYLLFTHALNSAVADIPSSATPEARATAIKAAEDVLYNVMMILEGVVGAKADAEHRIEFALIARVLAAESPHECVEQFELAPKGEEPACMGFHLWKEGNFVE
jgi:hypothetical protein